MNLGRNEYEDLWVDNNLLNLENNILQWSNLSPSLCRSKLLIDRRKLLIDRRNNEKLIFINSSEKICNGYG